MPYFIVIFPFLMKLGAAVPDSVMNHIEFVQSDSKAGEFAADTVKDAKFPANGIFLCKRTCLLA